MSKYWSAHTHSKYSAKDAMSDVGDMVRKASELKFPALGLTDHGNMGGAVQLYTNCRKADILPLPGVELYLAYNRNAEKRPKTVHMGMLATTKQGYRNLVGLVNQSHRQFKYNPMLDLADLAQAAEDGRLEGIAAMSGCWFGLLPETLKRPDANIDIEVENILTSMASWFGSGLYIELQNHKIFTDTQDSDEHVKLLYRIAKKLGLPAILTQDSHYIELEERPIHETMKRLMSWSDDPDSAPFPGDGYHMADDTWMKNHFDPEVYKAGIEGLTDLVSKANVVIPELDTFKLQVPDITLHNNPDEQLENACWADVTEKIGAGIISEKNQDFYEERILEELDVIINAGFSGYLLFAANVCEYMRKNDINYNVRGSASGSLLCWLLNITSYDPLKWNLRFDRFLSKDRTKPPDIDIDVEHDRREEVVNWLSENYNVINIGTWLQMTINADDEEQKGSLMVRYKMMLRKKGEDPNTKLNPDEWNQLKALSDKKTFSGYGVHAAGLLITPDEETAAVVPLQYVASSKTMVTSFDKDDVEKLGLLKLDLLGLKTLTALRIMQELSGVKIEDIPLNDRKVFMEISKGNTTGMFQLDGWSAKKGIKRLKPTKISDIIAAMALFRPATQQSGATDDFISRRNKLKPIPEKHPIISNETKDTYGVLLYQEQVIGVMRNVGLDSEEIETIRKVIKASNSSVGNAKTELDKLMKRIRTLAKEKGMNLEDLAWLEQALEAYAGYGFNKAHATAYGVLAYQTGYFAIHYPLAFWTGMLIAYTGAKQEDEYLIAARKAGVVILPPHVNKSKKGYTADLETNTIRKGLSAIKGVGDVAATELATHAPYDSLDDLARKVSARRVSGSNALGLGHSPESCTGIIAHLLEAGALDELKREMEIL